MPGLYFDELSVGQVFKHPIRRTITEADNVWFSCLTHNPAYLHLDEQYCQEHTEFGHRIVNSAFTLGLMVGISVNETTLGTAIANLGWDEVRFPAPVPVDSNLRLGVTVAGAEDVTGGVQVALDLTFETEGSTKPSCVAQVVFRYFH